MRSQLKGDITAGLLCHLFMATPPVTSQALPASGAGTVQSTPEQSSCHMVLTAPPALPSPTGPGPKPGAAGRTPRIPISQEQPVEITAQQCEKAGDVYTLRGEVWIKFGDYVFQGDTGTYNPSS